MAISTQTHGAMEYLVAQGITVPHAFTTRRSGVSAGAFASLNLGMHRGDREENVVKNITLLAQTVGFDPKALVLSHQVHGDTVRIVGRQDASGFDHHAYPPCDALITAEPGAALMVFSADCTPVLLHDPTTGAVGALHAGWRGTAASLAEKTVKAMVSAFGCRAEHIRAAIGPNIGQCCFETDREVPEAMLHTFGNEAKDFIRSGESKYYVNLKGLNALSLKNAGVVHIEISEECTACNHEIFWSHRITGGLRGSQGAVIVCKEGK